MTISLIGIEEAIFFPCSCGNRLCEGQFTIYHDEDKNGINIYTVSLIDSRGDEEVSIVLTKEQMLQLKQDIENFIIKDEPNV